MSLPDFTGATANALEAEARAAAEKHRARLDYKSNDSINHPAHYGGADDPYEAIKVIEAWELGFCLGNTVKYVCRAGKKGDKLEDLKKARWYLDREIQQLEGK